MDAYNFFFNVVTRYLYTSYTAHKKPSCNLIDCKLNNRVWFKPFDITIISIYYKISDKSVFIIFDL